MNKEFIPYEQALALKELGFDELCLGFYLNGHDKVISIGTDRVFTSIDLPVVKAPLYQQAFRWFREKHKLHHTIIWDSDTNNFDAGLFGELVIPFLEEDTIFNTYEEAEIACINKLIEIVKNK